MVLAATTQYARLYILFVTASMEAGSIVVGFVHAAEWRPKLPPKISFCNISWTHVDVFMGLAHHISVREQKHITKVKEAQCDSLSSLRTGKLMK
jgi:hypothetical protein